MPDAALAGYLNNLRQNCSSEVPEFDDRNGRSDALALFVLEAPGPKVSLTKKISIYNPDQTARNMGELLTKANFKPKDYILWNIVPWIICKEGKNKTPDDKEIEMGIGYLNDLISILPKIRALVLVGKKAQKAQKKIMVRNGIKIFCTNHPSPMHVNRRPENRQILQKVFYDVSNYVYA